MYYNVGMYYAYCAGKYLKLIIIDISSQCGYMYSLDVYHIVNA